MDLARNKLTKVDFQMFSDLQFIDTIDLSENQITEVSKESFANLFQTRINMSHNMIDHIGDGVFNSCDNMTFLDLSHNNFRGFTQEAFGDKSWTLELLLMHNNLTSMSQVCTVCTMKREY